MATKVKLVADGVVTADQLTLTTASTGTNTTAPATTAFVQQEVAALVDSSPDALNTLNELAAALGDDANFSTTVTNSIATKLPLAGGALTGNLSIGDSSSRSFALYVENAGSAGAGQIMLVDSDNDTLQREIRTDAGILSFDYWDSSNRSNHLTILANGNIGIGDTSPAAKLEIKQGSSNWYEGIRINRSDNATQFGTFSNNSGATFIGAADTAGGNNNAILFGNSTNGTTFTERMRIESDGQIKSVRTNTGNEPYINLELKNTGTAAGLSLDCQYSSGRKYEIQSDTNGQFIIYDRDAGDYRFTIQGDGNISIGQESGTGKFHVYQATAELTPRFEVGDTSVVGLRLINSSQQWRAGIQSTSSYVIRDVTNSRNTFTLDSSGNATLSGGLTLNGDIDGQNITQLRNHFSSMYVSPTNSNTLNAGYNQAEDSADIWINYRGYQDGTTYFRDFRIGDGKNNGLLFADGSTGDFTFFYDTKFGKVKLETNNTVTGQNYLTSGECYPLALRSRSTSATNTVAMTFGHETGDYSNFVGSQKTGSGGATKAEIVFGGRQANGQSFTEWGRWHDDGNLEMPYQSSFHASSTSNTATLSAGSSNTISDNFNKVNGTGQHNIGSDYNTSTGIYTAPVDGKYLFTYAIRWEVASYTWSNYHRTYISVNNVNDYEAAHAITGIGQPVANYYNHTGSVVVYLSAGDTVRLKGGQEGLSSQIYAGESGWSGTYLG